MRYVPTMFLAAAAIGFTAGPAMSHGQPGGEHDRARHGERLSIEDAQAAWQIQAHNVAAHLDLTTAATAELTAVYVASRQEFADAVAIARQERHGDKDARAERQRGEGRAGNRERADRGEGHRGDREARHGKRGARGMRGNLEQLHFAQETLAESLATALDPAELPIAMESLGTFSRAWDKQIHTVSQFELNDADTATLLDALLQYTRSVGKARDSQDAQVDREAIRDARHDLGAQLRDVLNEEQTIALRSTLGRRGHRGHRGHGESRRGDRGSNR